MLVNRDNFLKESNSLIQKLPTAAFVSLDLEVTGTQTPPPSSSRPSKFDQPSQERYGQIQDSAQRYSIIQIGICLFHENPEFRRYAKRCSVEDESRRSEEGGDGEDRRVLNPVEDDIGGGNGGDDGDAGAGGGGGGVLDDSGHVIVAMDDLEYQQQEDARRLLEAMPMGRFRCRVGRRGHGSDHCKNHGNVQHSGGGNHHHGHHHRALGGSVSFSFSDSYSSFSSSSSSSSASSSSSSSSSSASSSSSSSLSLVALEQPQPRNVERGGDDSESEDDLPQHLLNENRGPERSEPPEFLVRKYNFVLFPAGDGKREVVLNPKTMEYLNGQEMNLEEWIKRGIPYMTLKDAQDELDRFLTEHHHGIDNGSNNNNNCKKKKTTNGTMVDFNRNASSMIQVESACPTSQSEEEEEEEESVEEPTDPVDVAFVARSMAALREWIDSAAPQRGGVNVLSDNLTLLQEQRMGIVKILPHTRKEPVRRYLRRKIEYEYPALYWDTNDNQQVLVRLNDEEKQVRDARRKKYAWQKMHEEKIGFTRVFKALSDACRGQLGSTGSLDEEYEYFLSEADSKRARGVHKGHGNEICALLTKHASHKQGRRVPIVVHNGFLDFMFLLSHFSSDKLPSTHVEAKELIHDLFPLIYDTKVIATEFHESSMHLKQTSLEELHQRYVRGDTIPDIHDFVEVHLEYTPRSIVVNGSARIHTPARPREAGNNALMVGTVFQCLCRRIKWNSSDFLGLDNVNKKLKMLRAISRAKKCRVGSLLFLDEKVPESKLSAPLYGLNKVFMNHSIFTIDMESTYDPLKPGYISSAILKVLHPHRTIPIKDINNVIKSINDEDIIISRHWQKIHYEIGVTSKWFIVAARSRLSRGVDATDPTVVADIVSTLARRGELLMDALKSHFHDCEIISLEDTLINCSNWCSAKRKRRNAPCDNGTENDDGNTIVAQNGMISRLANALGFRTYSKRENVAKRKKYAEDS